MGTNDGRRKCGHGDRGRRREKRWRGEENGYGHGGMKLVVSKKNVLCMGKDTVNGMSYGHEGNRENEYES